MKHNSFSNVYKIIVLIQTKCNIHALMLPEEKRTPADYLICPFTK